MRPLLTAARHLNVARPICDHLLGEEHTHHHRMMIGTFVMTVGVTIAKVAGHNDIMVVAVHGLGLTPFVEYLLSQITRQKEEV